MELVEVPVTQEILVTQVQLGQLALQAQAIQVTTVTPVTMEQLELLAPVAFEVLEAPAAVEEYGEMVVPQVIQAMMDIQVVDQVAPVVVAEAKVDSNILLAQ